MTKPFDPTKPQRRHPAIWILLVFAALVGMARPSHAELTPDKLPALTGRVVDDANVLSADDRTALSAKLKDLEDQSGTQFVVATVPSLQGEEVEPYANALFRKWRLGQKDKNNGLLFLIAPSEHRTRFEVGYGLEGTLTDALTKLILRNAVTPKFKANDFPGGIKAGVDEATAVLTTDKASWQKRPALTDPDDQPMSAAMVWFIVLVIVVALVFLFRFRRSINWTSSAAGFTAGSLTSGGSSTPSSGSNDSFSGGGGDSGGGGSSDSW